MAGLRCFVAVELSESQGKALAALLREIRGSSADCSVVPEGQLHVTLAFLGEKSEGQVSAIVSSLEKVRGRQFDFEIRGAGILPNDSFARVFYAGIPSSLGLSELQEKVATVLNLREERPFLPHVTLARIKSRKNLPQLVSLKNKFEAENFGECVVSSFFLKKSLLSPSGAVYENIREFGLEQGE